MPPDSPIPLPATASNSRSARQISPAVRAALGCMVAGVRPQLAMRAQIVLLSSDGKLNQHQIAQRLGTSPRNVRVWWRNFLAGGINSLARVAQGRGRMLQHNLTPDQFRKVVAEWQNQTEESMAARLSQREIARRTGQSLATVNRFLLRHGWRLPDGYIKRTQLQSKATVILGVFLDPPFRALALRHAPGLPDGISQADISQSVKAANHAAVMFENLLLEWEARLSALPKRAGRYEAWTRFLRNITTLITPAGRQDFKVGVWCQHSHGREFRREWNLLQRYPNLTGFRFDKTSAGWVADALVRGRLLTDSKVSLVDEIRTVERLLMCRERNRQGRERLHRPFIYLAKRKSAGFDCYHGDWMKSEEHQLKLKSPVKPSKMPDLTPTDTNMDVQF